MQDSKNSSKARIGIQSELTRHAWERMTSRSLSVSAVQATMAYGRVVYARGAKIYAIGRKEVERYSQEGVDLAKYEGVQVVCAPQGTILTVYRNRDFRGLRPSRRHYWPAA